MKLNTEEEEKQLKEKAAERAVLASPSSILHLEPPQMIFNKPSGMTVQQRRNSFSGKSSTEKLTTRSPSEISNDSGKHCSFLFLATHNAQCERRHRGAATFDSGLYPFLKLV